MKQGLREALGKAVAARLNELDHEHNGPPFPSKAWEHLSERAREECCVAGEAAILSFLSMIVPGVVSAVFEQESQDYQDVMDLVQAKEHQRL